MIQNKFLAYLIVWSLFLVPLQSMAQSSTASPYSMYGIGMLNMKGDVINAGMGHTGVAMKSQGYLNTLNPASYSAIDSLSFLFNVQASGSFGYYETNSQSQTNFAANIDGLSFGFKVSDNWGMNIGFAPYSTIGYTIQSEKYFIGTENTYPVEYTGEGGLTQVYWGNGIQLFKGFSLGVNLSFVWGSIENIETSYYPIITGETIHNRKSHHVNNLYLEYGFQYHLPIQKNTLSFGAVINTETNMNTTYEHSISTDGGQEYFYESKNADDMLIPMKYSTGLSYQTHTGWTAAFDYHHSKWSSFDEPMTTAEYQNTNSYHLGFQYAPQRMGYKSIFRRIQYRVGAFYSDNYLTLNGVDLDEKGFTMGITIPVRQKTLLNVGYEFKQAGSLENGLIRETYNGIKIGVTFNESWFRKSLFQ
ncbi:MAG: hypothetical protein JEZ14_23010 [Marinilabiliaceae bacterium]|nr:hypothetical protein [Marinilabiliaceae bacterium]